MDSPVKQKAFISSIVAVVVTPALVVAAFWALSITQSDANNKDLGPITGIQMIEFLESDAERLRVAMNNYDTVYTLAKAAGHRPFSSFLQTRELTAASVDIQ